MKFLQLNITSFNTSCDDLWYHKWKITMMESSCKKLTTAIHDLHDSRKFQKLGSEYMHMIFKNKTLGYGVGTFLPNTTKKYF